MDTFTEPKTVTFPAPALSRGLAPPAPGGHGDGGQS
jgi:hypothetical protein